jgi:hypothetical protein
MKRFIIGFAVLPFLCSVALAGQAVTHKQLLLDDEQMDSVSAGKLIPSGENGTDYVLTIFSSTGGSKAGQSRFEISRYGFGISNI